MTNLLVAQSGGPTAVINSSLAGVISGAVEFSYKIDKIYGSLQGIEGVEADNIIPLDDLRSDENIRLLKQTPSSYLGSCRRKLPEESENPEVYVNIFNTFKKYSIGFFFYIGGNDSMDTADKLSRYAKNHGIDIKIAGIPKTIDNDLAITDHTPGFGSAAKFVANSMRQLALDTGVYKMKSVIVLEIMGRNAGWLTAAAALGNDSSTHACDIICLPETPFDIDLLLTKSEKISNAQGTVMIAVSEGIRTKDGKYVTDNTEKLFGREDKFAHAALGGVGKTVEDYIQRGLGLKTRTIELSTLQRCWSTGASACDINEAFQAGLYGVRFACEGMTGFMPSFERISSKPYEIKITPHPVGEIANLEKKVPSSMISSDGLGVTDEFLSYASPLIQGEPELIYKNGVIQFLRR